ncbi:polyprenyl synthetase family protein [Staphylococcus massiliensis]|uniref:Farnesyl diphosphate synthase n=1 Tax=Staphylococcus massiliensis S46 TaxID=1229783 RepID=K9AQZ8_9STAP|nr:farnesyl diphosphate synthase [Staphylococcus massiliensis]EKU49853.1 geranyltranstransferase [Staphylococcus massiliensis S46]POA02055.1 polyprenyl synthetase family protein [Staphylococcus massiliensis CCUG 55927]
MITPHMKQTIDDINNVIEQSIETSELNTNLEESMRYSLQAGGKRIRPLLMLLTIDMIDPNAVQNGYQTAIALEMIHTYSLIHDDLPAMDNDDYRRGKLTNHKVYGEWKAILAGDALLTKAFEIITKDEKLEPTIQVQLIKDLAIASGHMGMIGGQTIDMESEDKTISLSQLETIHRYKTGALLKYAVLAGAHIAKVDGKYLNALDTFGDALGMIFQIKDDLLDIYGDEAEIGKPTGSDVANNKNTYVSLLGEKETNARLHAYVDQAHNALNELENEFDTSELQEITKLMYQRTK